MEAQSLLDNIVTTINTAIIRGDGFSIELDLPESIHNSAYSVIINESWVYINVTTHNMMIFKSIFSGNITGTPVPGKNIVRNYQGAIAID